MTTSLTVSRIELVEALKALKKFASKKGIGQAVLSFESGMLTIQLAGVVVRASASGSWDGEARMPGQVMSRMWRSVPDTDPVEIEVGDEHLKIGPLTISCICQPNDVPRIHLPMNAPLPVVLCAALNHTSKEIACSGLADVVEKAEQKRDELTDRAYKALQPLGISYEDLEGFIQEHLQAMKQPD